MEEKDVFSIDIESESGIDSVVSTRGRGLSTNKKSDGMNDIMNYAVMILMRLDCLVCYSNYEVVLEFVFKISTLQLYRYQQLFSLLYMLILSSQGQ